MGSDGRVLGVLWEMRWIETAEIGHVTCYPFILSHLAAEVVGLDTFLDPF